MTPLRFGFVGTGMIARAMADAIKHSANARLVAVASRSHASAKSFADKHAPAAVPIEGIDNLLSRTDIDAIYIATPTASKEPIALRALAASKHILVEKPFIDAASVQRMTAAAAKAGLVFMDATHFIHHPRTAALQSALAHRVGSPRSLHTSLYFPWSGRENIRFDRSLEPTGVLGDLGWYSARAIVEYLRPAGKVAAASTVIQTDEPTNAIIRATGLLSFSSGEVSTFDVGVTAGTLLMDFQLLGTAGVVTMDDFVLDWNNSWSLNNPHIKAGFTHRTESNTRKDASFIETPAASPQQVEMFNSFATLAQARDHARAADLASATLKTQHLLDAMWAGIAHSVTIPPSR